MLDFTRFEILTFDCYGTLIYWEAGILSALHRILDAHGKFGDEFRFAPSAEEVRSLPDSLPNWKPWPDTVAALRRLKTRFRLAIFSNVDDDLFAGTRPQLGVDFDEVVTAQQALAYKPSLKLFDLALSRIHAPAHRVLHVAQSVYHDIVPAQSLGLATVWVNRPSARPGVGAVKAAEAKPDLTVASLAELAATAIQD